MQQQERRLRENLLRWVLAIGIAIGLGFGASAMRANAGQVDTKRPTQADIAQLLASPRAADVATGLRLMRDTRRTGLEEALYTAAQRPEPELASAALYQFAATGDSRALPLLEAAIASGHPARLSSAVVWLSAFGTDGLKTAVRLLKHTNRSVRKAVIQSLAQFPPSANVRAVLQHAQRSHVDRRTRAYAAAVLTTHR